MLRLFLFHFVVLIFSNWTGTRLYEYGGKELGITTVSGNYPLPELVPGMDWYHWYEAESGYTAHPIYFGAYVILGVGTDLYIGLGSARPAEQDGAFLAKFDGQNVVPIGSLIEQGVHEMGWDGEILHIAGSDPCCEDDWSAGNHYTYHPSGSLLKWRDPENGLVNVIHTWGLWLSDEQTLYAAVSSHAGDTFVGQIFYSLNDGASWNHLSDLGDSYRVYDIYGFHDKLYAIYTTAIEAPQRLAVSADGGRTWQDALEADIRRIHLTEFNDKLLAVGFDQRSIYALNETGIDSYLLPPGVTLGVSYPDIPEYSDYNILVVADGYLVTIWTEDDGGTAVYTIVRTDDLQTWERLAKTEQPLILLSYWPDQNWLIVGSNGIGATLWRLDLDRFDPTLYLPFVCFECG